MQRESTDHRGKEAEGQRAEREREIGDGASLQTAGSEAVRCARALARCDSILTPLPPPARADLCHVVGVGASCADSAWCLGLAP